MKEKKIIRLLSGIIIVIIIGLAYFIYQNNENEKIKMMQEKELDNVYLELDSISSHNLRNRSCQRRLAMVNMANSADIYMRLRTIKLLFRHLVSPAYSKSVNLVYAIFARTSSATACGTCS